MCDESHTWYRFIFALNRDEKICKNENSKKVLKVSRVKSNQTDAKFL